MLSSYLYWFIYRRRTKVLLCLMIIFCVVIYFHQNDSQPSSGAASPRIERNVHGDKLRVNRETYSTPEPCRGCPGEDGQGVALTVM